MQIDIRPTQNRDAPELSSLLNKIVEIGGTTALEESFSASTFSTIMINDLSIICCFVAVEQVSNNLLGFQLLERCARLADNIGNIATFTRLGLTRRGIGSSLFQATRNEARKNDLAAINATIRADNYGGLAFYKALGFVDYHVRSAVPLRDGTLVDRISKIYILESEGEVQEVDSKWVE